MKLLYALYKPECMDLLRTESFFVHKLHNAHAPVIVYCIAVICCMWQLALVIIQNEKVILITHFRISLAQ